jgi:hypothetical protein
MASFGFSAFCASKDYETRTAGHFLILKVKAPKVRK